MPLGTVIYFNNYVISVSIVNDNGIILCLIIHVQQFRKMYSLHIRYRGTTTIRYLKLCSYVIVRFILLIMEAYRGVKLSFKWNNNIKKTSNSFQFFLNWECLCQRCTHLETYFNWCLQRHDIKGPRLIVKHHFMSDLFLFFLTPNWNHYHLVNGNKWRYTLIDTFTFPDRVVLFLRLHSQIVLYCF